MRKTVYFVSFMILSLMTACSPVKEQGGEKGDMHIVAHSQYSENDKITCLGWETEVELTLKIDDPENGEGVDFTNTRFTTFIAENKTMADFDLGSEWDLLPGHRITVSDGTNTISHTVRDITLTSADVETDILTGTAAPGTEVMVWIEAPYEHELRVFADSDGEWIADFSGVTDIIPASIGAIAQNDVPPAGSSHTRINFTFGDLHLETLINSDVIGFNNFTPFNLVDFQVFEAKDGALVYEDTIESNEVGYSTFEIPDSVIDLQPGTFIHAVDRSSQRQVDSELELLSIDKVERDTADISGTTVSGKTVHVNIYDRASEAEYSQQVSADESGVWQIRFEMQLTEEMDIIARIQDVSGNEIAYLWTWN